MAESGIWSFCIPRILLHFLAPSITKPVKRCNGMMIDFKSEVTF